MQAASEYTPLVYGLIGFGIAGLCFCCVLCCLAVYVYKRRVLDKKEKGAQAEEPPLTERGTLDPNVIQIRTVEADKGVKNAFHTPRFASQE
jgi:hypothetical protein